ncbi:MAG: right-handed parallel beta-helix repeat-containing protein, partial [Eubacterium sp.]|nr:right-handed parallel beta-helix repeat-containing protein [Eubacterium sp.]
MTSSTLSSGGLTTLSSQSKTSTATLTTTSGTTTTSSGSSVDTSSDSGTQTTSGSATSTSGSSTTDSSSSDSTATDTATSDSATSDSATTTSGSTVTVGTYVTVSDTDEDGDIWYELNEALTEARDNATEDCPYYITVTPGTYNIYEQLTVYSNTSLILSGVTIYNDYGSSMILLTSTDDSATGYNGACNISITGGTFDNAYESNAIMRFVHAQNITISGVTFKNVTDCHHLEFAASKNVTFKNCSFLNYKGQDSNTNEALQIDILNSDRFPLGPYDGTTSVNITVTGCTFKNVESGVGTHSAIRKYFFTNVKITNNTFVNLDGYAISATNYANSTISGNTITNCAAGIRFRTMTSDYSNFHEDSSVTGSVSRNLNSTISNNTISISSQSHFSSTYGIQVYGVYLSKKTSGVAAGDYRTRCVTITGNTITLKDKGYAIRMIGTVSCTVSSNKITVSIAKSCNGKGAGDALRLTKSVSTTVTRNTIAITKKNSACKSASGIVLNGSSSGTVSYNTISSANLYGVKVSGKSTVNVTGNRIAGAKNTGVYVTGKSTAKIIKNTIANAKRYGVYVSLSPFPRSIFSHSQKPSYPPRSEWNRRGIRCPCQRG